MRISPLSFNLNTQVKNNKAQNQPKLKPMACDSVSFGAVIPDAIWRNAQKNSLKEFLEHIVANKKCEQIENFWQQSEEEMDELFKNADNETRKKIYGNSAFVQSAYRHSMAGYLISTTQNDDELNLLLNTEISSKDNKKEAPLKGLLSFGDYIHVLERFSHPKYGKVFLLDSWIKGIWLNGAYYSSRLETFESNVAKEIKEQEQNPEDKRGFAQQLYKIIFSDSTTNEEAIKLIEQYKGFCNVTDEFYLVGIKKYLETQI